MGSVLSFESVSEQENLRHVDPEKILLKLGIDNATITDRQWAWSSCPIHQPDSNPSFSICLDKDSDHYLFWKCHHDPDCKGNIYKLISILRDISEEEAKKLFADWFEMDFVSCPEPNDLLKLIEHKRFHQHHGKIPLPRTSSVTGPIIHYLMHGRKNGYTKEESEKIIQKWGLRFAEDGYYRDRIIIPVNDVNGKQVFFQAQAVHDVSHLEGNFAKKKLFPANTHVSDHLLGLDRLVARGIRQMVVVEGFFDMCALNLWGIPCVSSFSADLSQEQESLLVEYADRVWIWYDNDLRDGRPNPGRRGAEKACLSLSYNGIETYLVDGPPNVDPDEVGGSVPARKILREKTTPYIHRNVPSINRLLNNLSLLLA